MNRTQVINQILQQRKPLVQKIEQVETLLKQRQEFLKELEQLRLTIIPQLDNPVSVELLKKLDLNKLQSLIDSALEALSKLKRRFARTTLNIGVVGRARQGKSRLLQSISGLTGAEIPDGDREHCTGVRSTIYHNRNGNQETYGVVWFHSERSFLQEIITPYYAQLKLGTPPQSIQEFAQNDLPELPAALNTSAEYKAKYEHLKRYKDNLGKYYKLLGTTEAKALKITREQIREYVAQDNEQGDRIYFNYLAVKEVKIFCPFPQADIGQIALIDLPGLGDTGIGDQERLIKTVGEDVDVIIFVKKPQKGDYWADVDVKLYDITKSSLVEIPVSLWSYMILNHTPTVVDNYLNCQDLQKSIKDNHIEVQETVIVDCAEKTEVSVFLDQVLNNLVSSIKNLDRKYARTCQDRIQELGDIINSELNQVRTLLDDYANIPRQFLGLFNRFIDNLSYSMMELRQELQQKIGTVDPYFENQVKLALDTCKLDPGIPSEDDILRRSVHPEYKGSLRSVYYAYIAELRAHISQHFLSLNQGLQESMFNLKNTVANLLIDEVRLGELTDQRGVNFLKYMATLFESKNNKLELGFRTFADFEMSYGALLLQLIRQHLNDLLSPDTNKMDIENMNAKIIEVLSSLAPNEIAAKTMMLSSEMLSSLVPNEITTKTVKKNLQLLYDEAIAKCEATLNEWLTKPSEVEFFMFEEFSDRILFAEGMKDEWFAFLDDDEIRSKVWMEFRQIEERKHLQMSWKNQVIKTMIPNQELVFL